jgi:hypothetical protein
MTEQTRTKRTQTSMSQVGFEPTIPVLGRENTVHTLHRSAAVIGLESSTAHKIQESLVTFGRT